MEWCLVGVVGVVMWPCCADESARSAARAARRGHAVNVEAAGVARTGRGSQGVAQQWRVHHTGWLVGGEARVRVCHLVAKLLLPSGTRFGKDDADGPIQIVAALGRAADVEVDEVAQCRTVRARNVVAVLGSGRDLGFDDGSSWSSYVGG